jgi:hypothetical protein
MIDETRTCEQCEEAKTVGCFYPSTSRDNRQDHICIGCRKENRMDGDKLAMAQRRAERKRNRKDRDNRALNAGRTKAIQYAKDMLWWVNTGIVIGMQKTNEDCERAQKTLAYWEKEVDAAEALPVL